MPQPPNKKENPGDIDEAEDESSLWSEDQKKRQYYYDDAHGYEVYRPEDDDIEIDPDGEDQ